MVFVNTKLHGFGLVETKDSNNIGVIICKFKLDRSQFEIDGSMIWTIDSAVKIISTLNLPKRFDLQFGTTNYCLVHGSQWFEIIIYNLFFKEYLKFINWRI